MGIKITDKIKITEIFRRTQTKNLVNVITKQKLNYAGHVARTQHNRWNRRVTVWIPPHGKRRVGRPHTRWVDEIVGAAGQGWALLAKQRDSWTDLVEAYTQSGALSEEGSDEVSLT